MAGQGDSGWCTIESDDGVFTELMSAVGVKGVQVQEMISLEREAFVQLPKVYGLIFLFKWKASMYKQSDKALAQAPPGVVFAKQVINNACGTQALLHILLNRPDVELGDEVGNLKAFVGAMDAEMAGLCIGNSDVIRTAHNSFARPEPFVSEKPVAATDDDDVFHFVAYVPVNGVVYELDGLQPGPIPLGACSDGPGAAGSDSGSGSSGAGDAQPWLDVIRPVITQRIASYAADEVHFNLLALVRDKRLVIDEELAAATAPDTIARLTREREEEDARYARWAIENARRRHNYVPFVYQLLMQLAKRGRLAALTTAGQAKAKARGEREAKRRADAMAAQAKAATGQ